MHRAAGRLRPRAPKAGRRCRTTRRTRPDQQRRADQVGQEARQEQQEAGQHGEEARGVGLDPGDVGFARPRRRNRASRPRPAWRSTTNPASVVASISRKRPAAARSGAATSTNTAISATGSSRMAMMIHFTMMPVSGRGRGWRGGGDRLWSIRGTICGRCRPTRLWMPVACLHYSVGRACRPPVASDSAGYLTGQSRPPQEHARRVRYLHHHLPGARSVHFLASAQRARVSAPAASGHRTIPMRPRSGATPTADDKVVTLPGRAPDKAPKPRRARSRLDRWKGIAEPGSTLAAGLDAIAREDKTFDAKNFVERRAGRLRDDRDRLCRRRPPSLKDLLGREVYDGFEAAIRSASSAARRSRSRFVSIDAAEIIAAELRGKTAQVTVRFVSQLVSVTRDRSGAVIDGNPDKVTTVTDVWTFARDVSSRDPELETGRDRSWAMTGGLAALSPQGRTGAAVAAIRASSRFAGARRRPSRSAAASSRRSTGPSSTAGPRTITLAAFARFHAELQGDPAQGGDARGPADVPRRCTRPAQRASS